jgi:hypothetical protein
MPSSYACPLFPVNDIYTICSDMLDSPTYLVAIAKFAREKVFIAMCTACAWEATDLAREY